MKPIFYQLNQIFDNILPSARSCHTHTNANTCSKVQIHCQINFSNNAQCMLDFVYLYAPWNVHFIDKNTSCKKNVCEFLLEGVEIL